MSCRISWVTTPAQSAIFIREPAKFNFDAFREEVEKQCRLQVINETITHQCFGPLELTKVITTTHGVFTYELIMEGSEFDMGLRLFSTDHDLMRSIFEHMLASKRYTTQRA